jgi:hypothetical protein
MAYIIQAQESIHVVSCLLSTRLSELDRELLEDDVDSFMVLEIFPCIVLTKSFYRST